MFRSLIVDIDHITQFLAGLEVGGPLRQHIDGFPGSGVAASLRAHVMVAEYPKTTNLDPVAVSKGLPYICQNLINRLVYILPG